MLGTNWAVGNEGVESNAEVCLLRKPEGGRLFGRAYASSNGTMGPPGDLVKFVNRSVTQCNVEGLDVGRIVSEAAISKTLEHGGDCPVGVDGEGETKGV